LRREADPQGYVSCDQLSPLAEGEL
jgi:hypothetical protein